MTDDRRTRDSCRCRRGHVPVHAMAYGELALMHARLGTLARWTCRDCFPQQRQGSWPCSRCTGFTGKRDQVATGVTDVVGRPSKRVPS